MTILSKYHVAHKAVLRDVRPVSKRIADFWTQTEVCTVTGFTVAAALIFSPEIYGAYSDLIFVCLLLYVRAVFKTSFTLPFKFPQYAKMPDAHNQSPGKSGPGKSEGILYLGNIDEKDNPENNRELWLTNSDARTHILFLGTTGSGKTEGLKSLVANALAWGSGFVYVDGKADTDLWASLYSLARRFGRDDDLLVLNYMTANSDDGAVSNTMNPFSNGSASYLTNMVVGLMPDAGGDNAMWKERAIALMGALMPALTWKRDKQGLLLDVSILRDFIELPAIIRLSRDPNLPERIIRALSGYLNTLPGYVDAAFDDEGNERPPAPDQPMYDLQVARQQHGYLSMQFTRSLQSLGDEYGYIFKAQLADVDVLDVVLNRRILVALIPALEKSGDEAANLGKIIAASLKGMMGSTLGNTVEGSWENAIGSKQTRSSSSFMTVFDEVGYYTAPGMAVMAAQARSLGFSLIFAAQDLPSMEKRVKQEAQSILGNCNLKIFGKLEDPTDTKDFFSKQVGDNFVMESTGMNAPTNTVSNMFFDQPYYDNRGAGTVQARVRAHYDQLRMQREGQVHMLFAEYIVKARMFYAVPDKVKALRVHKMLPVPATTTATQAKERALAEATARLKTKDWSAATALPEAKTMPGITALTEGLIAANAAGRTALEAGVSALGLFDRKVEKHAASRKKGALAQTQTLDDDLMLEAAPAAQSKSQAVPSSSAGESDAPGGFDFSGYALPAQAKPFSAQENDEYAIGELAAVAEPSTTPASSDMPVSASKTNGAIPQDLDTDVVPALSRTEEIPDLDLTALPEGMLGFMAHIADKLNKGLGEGTRAS